MREIVVTKDGSHTIAIPEQRVTYHSIHGAVRESNHVFIEAGLRHLKTKLADSEINIFEMGFGTGLNAFLTGIEAVKTKSAIHYTSIDTAPLSTNEAALLNYPQDLCYEDLFRNLHHCNWGEDAKVNEFFTVQKIQTDLLQLSAVKQFHLIYYDAFAPSAQPQLWTKEVFDKLYNMLTPAGILVTYCSKGDVRRAMMAAGFTVKKLPGPPGKREMLRAEKID